MIGTVALDAITYADPPHRFEAGTPAIIEAIGLGAASLGRARATGPGRGPGAAGVVLGVIGLLGAIAVTTLFLLVWPKVSGCLDGALSSDAAAQCVRDHLGLPTPEPSRGGDGPTFSIRRAQVEGPIMSTLDRSTTRWT